MPTRLGGTAQHRRPAAGWRIAATALLTGVVVLVAGGSSAYWLCVPGVLVAASVAESSAGIVGGAAAVAAVAAATLQLRHSPLPSPLLALLVPGASAAVLSSVRRRLERERDRLRDVAETDALTGLANRRLLHARADYEIARHRREGHSFALVMADLDGFKALNDRFGHAAGDELLCDVAAALADALRAQDTIARLGGDEFCVLAPETDRAGVQQLAHRVRYAVATATRGVEALGATVGVALFPDDGTTTTALLEAADRRLLAGKRVRYGNARRRAA